MKKRSAIYQPGHHLSSIFMLVVLLWLTVSAPFVFAAQQTLAEKQVALLSATAGQQDNSNEEQSCAPLGSNTTEEKAPNGLNSLSEEYLHADNELSHLTELPLGHTRSHTFAEYVAFHGEMLCPPPNLLD